MLVGSEFGEGRNKEGRERGRQGKGGEEKRGGSREKERDREAKRDKILS